MNHARFIPPLALMISLVATTASAQTNALPPHVQRFGPVLSSRVKGSPEPPPMFRVERAYPGIHVQGLIMAAFEPGSGRMIYVDRPKGAKVTRVRRAGEGFDSGTAVTLVETNQTTYSIAFHPGYATNGFLYTGSKTHWRERPHQTAEIKRHTIARRPPFDVVPDSGRVIIEWPSNGHDGAAMAFALDGTLFVTTGDGTSSSDDDNRGQSLDHLLAKVLRIDVDHVPPGRTYSVPADNPFVNRPGARPETWAFGFRNPWRAAVDAKTGHLWVTQNGQDTTEQTYFVTRGGNYGWSVYEGARPFRLQRALGPAPVTFPAADHGHFEARSLTGGIVYHGAKHPELRGAYLYGDYATGKIWAIRHDGERVTWHREIADTSLAITGFLEDAGGDLLVSDYQTSTPSGLYRLVPNPQRDRPASFPRRLSESGLFVSVREHRLQPEVIPYEVNAPLWSDGAVKARFLALGTNGPGKARFASRRGWDFPDETVAIKSFALELREGDPASRRWIETRFLTRQEGEWVGYSYQWNEEQTDAALVGAEGRDRSFKIQTAGGGTREQVWRFPGRAECMVCHTRASRYLLGLSTPQMNRDLDYSGGHVANQLEVWNQLGLFERPLKPEALKKEPKLVDPYDARQDLNARARSYLQANCAICHVSEGGGDSQLELEFHQTLAGTGLVNAEPVHGTLEFANAKLLVPGRPESSVLWQRLARRGPGQMPPLATSVVDRTGVQLMRDWIRSLNSPQ